VRWLPNADVDRARTRVVGAWRATRRLSLALEFNPGEDELLPNFNYSPSLPSEHIPGIGLVSGTSSDRIGTPSGRSWFASLSLDPRAWGLDIPISGYAGMAYGTWANDTRAIGGVRWAVMDRLSATLQFDGEQLHAVTSYALGPLGPGHATWSVDLLLVEIDGSRSAGLTLSTRF